MKWLESILLGALQGLTEFLPISSSGHLVVFQQAFAAATGRSSSGAENLFVNVMLHVGTLVAILFYYRGTIANQWQRFRASEPGEAGRAHRHALVRIGLLALVATLPAIGVGLTAKDRVEQATGSPWVAAIGFLVTGVVLLVTRLLAGGGKGPEQTRWSDALLIGTAQAVAILPGVSRSGMTIVAALALGLQPAWAVGFSLLMACVAIPLAAGLEILHIDPATLSLAKVLQTLAGAVVAGVVGYLSIVWLMRLVQGRRLWYFSVYLFGLSLAVMWWLSRPGGASIDERPSTTVDRTVWVGDDRASGAAVRRGIGPDNSDRAGGGLGPVAWAGPGPGPWSTGGTLDLDVAARGAGAHAQGRGKASPGRGVRGRAGPG